MLTDKPQMFKVISLEIDGSYKIKGIDLSPEMINIAKRNIPGCRFCVQDIRDIKPDKEFDAIIASFCKE